jgi:hypothetical protein
MAPHQSGGAPVAGGVDHAEYGSRAGRRARARARVDGGEVLGLLPQLVALGRGSCRAWAYPSDTDCGDDLARRGDTHFELGFSELLR